jgi:hypothetical protein
VGARSSSTKYSKYAAKMKRGHRGSSAFGKTFLILIINLLIQIDKIPNMEIF